MWKPRGEAVPDYAFGLGMSLLSRAKSEDAAGVATSCCNEHLLTKRIEIFAFSGERISPDQMRSLAAEFVKSLNRLAASIKGTKPS